MVQKCIRIKKYGAMKYIMSYKKSRSAYSLNVCYEVSFLLFYLFVQDYSKRSTSPDIFDCRTFRLAHKNISKTLEISFIENCVFRASAELSCSLHPYTIEKCVSKRYKLSTCTYLNPSSWTLSIKPHVSLIFIVETFVFPLLRQNHSLLQV